MAAKKIRIHELAKELGMTNAEVLDLCGVLGVAARGPSSSIAEAYADMVTRRAERDGLTRKEQPPEEAGALGEPSQPRPKTPRLDRQTPSPKMRSSPPDAELQANDGPSGGDGRTPGQARMPATPDVTDGNSDRGREDRSRWRPERTKRASEPVVERTHSDFDPRAVGDTREFGAEFVTRYPYPLAHRWQVTRANVDQESELQCILDAQETLLTYLAMVVLTSARLGQVSIGYLDGLGERLAKARGGATLGDWRGILMEAAQSRKMRRLPDEHPFVAARHYFADATTVEASDRLSALRNDRAHGRAFGPGERAIATQAARADLGLLYGAASPIASYQLVHVEASQWDSLGGSNLVTFRRLHGPTHLVPRESITAQSSDIETGSLYLLGEFGQLTLISPLLVADECPECGQFSTFHPDRVNGDGSVEYKSLEHGHCVTPVNGRDRLAAVGFLKP